MLEGIILSISSVSLFKFRVTTLAILLFVCVTITVAKQAIVLCQSLHGPSLQNFDTAAAKKVVSFPPLFSFPMEEDRRNCLSAPPPYFGAIDELKGGGGEGGSLRPPSQSLHLVSPFPFLRVELKGGGEALLPGILRRTAEMVESCR